MEWRIYFKEDGVIVYAVFTDIHLVSRFEKELRDNGQVYATDFYKDGVLVKKSDRWSILEGVVNG